MSTAQQTAVEITCGATRARFRPELAMLACSFSHDGEELLALPASSKQYRTSSAATAAPLLFPWANRLASESYVWAQQRVDLCRHRDLVQYAGRLPIHCVCPHSCRSL